MWPFCQQMVCPTLCDVSHFVDKFVERHHTRPSFQSLFHFANNTLCFPGCESDHWHMDKEKKNNKILFFPKYFVMVFTNKDCLSRLHTALKPCAVIIWTTWWPNTLCDVWCETPLAIGATPIDYIYSLKTQLTVYFTHLPQSVGNPIKSLNVHTVSK